GRRPPGDARQGRSKDRYPEEFACVPDRHGPPEPRGLLFPERGIRFGLLDGQRRRDPDVRDWVGRRNSAPPGARDATDPSLDFPRRVRGPASVHRDPPGGKRGDWRGRPAHQLGTFATEENSERRELAWRRQRCAKNARTSALLT